MIKAYKLTALFLSLFLIRYKTVRKMVLQADHIKSLFVKQLLRRI